MFSFFKKNKLPNNAPKFLIIGAQKAGTTALYSYLSKHDSIQATTTKEHHFFNCTKNYKKGINYYHSLFPTTNKNEINFDASPGYLNNKDCAKRIYDYNKDIKLIILVRNPVERAYSAWNMYLKRYKQNINWFLNDWVGFCNTEEEVAVFSKRNVNNIFDFNKFVEEELETFNKYSEQQIEAPILSHGFYSMQIEHYYKFFSKKQILIIENREFETNTVGILKKIESFLNLKEHGWEQENLSKVFQGTYKQDINVDTYDKLQSYYCQANENLFELIGKRYDWNDK